MLLCRCCRMFVPNAQTYLWCRVWSFVYACIQIPPEQYRRDCSTGIHSISLSPSWRPTMASTSPTLTALSHTISNDLLWNTYWSAYRKLYKRYIEQIRYLFIVVQRPNYIDTISVFIIDRHWQMFTSLIFVICGQWHRLSNSTFFPSKYSPEY